MTDFSQQNIWLNIDKPLGMTSAKAVAIVKRITRAKKVGHGGTLDPLASGVLPIALNRATKTSQSMMDAKKKYFFRVQFGAFTTTDDAEGDVVESSEKRPNLAEIQAILPEFVGAIKQTPSKFSAIKVNGKRAYELARQGVEFEMKAREIEIFSLEIMAHDPEFVDLEVECSKGTYVRTLAHDICQKLGVCGHVVVLRRLAVGDFKVEEAMDLDKLEKEAASFIA